jgi:DNA polymerase elongation subunit (family B)
MATTRIQGYVFRINSGEEFLDNSSWSGQHLGKYFSDEPYLNALKHPKHKPWNAKSVINVWFLCKNGKLGYAEVDCPCQFSVQLPEGLNEKVLLRKAEEDLRLEKSSLFQNSVEERKHYAVGYDTKKYRILTIKFHCRMNMMKAADYFKKNQNVKVHEEWIDLVQRFRSRTGIGTCCWVNFDLRPFSARGRTDCDIEGKALSVSLMENPHPDPFLPIHAWDIETVSGNKQQWEVMRQTDSGKSVFPDLNRPTNKIIQISSVYDDGKGEIKQILFELNPTWISMYGNGACSRKYRGQKYELRVFPSERLLIMAFLDYRRSLRAPFDLQYNGSNFDIPYVIGRVFMEPNAPIRTLVFGREPHDRYESYYDPSLSGRVKVVDSARENRQLLPEASGVVHVDLCEVFKSGKFGALRSYKLKDVTRKYLGEEAAKEPLNHVDIFDCYYGFMSKERYNQICVETKRNVVEENPSQKNQWWLLRDYCLADSAVLLDLWKLKMQKDIIETSKFSGVELQKVINRKTKELVSTMFISVALQRNNVVNKRQRTLGGSDQNSKDGPRYEGAVVLDVMKGLYAGVPDDTPSAEVEKTFPEKFDLRLIPKQLLRRTDFFIFISTLDFASLYPSIMLLLNLCVCTLIMVNGILYGCETDKPSVPEIPDEVLKTLPAGLWADAPMSETHNCIVVPSPGNLPFLFWFSKEKKGIFYEMVETVLTERRRYKKIMQHLEGLAADLEQHGVEYNVLSRIQDTRVVSNFITELFDKKQKITTEGAVDYLFQNKNLSKEQILYAAKEEADLFNARQLVRKVVCNAMYGSCGYDDTKGDESKEPSPISSVEVAASITAHGRQMIRRVQEAVTARGYKTVAGDTDSVIIEVEARNLKEAWEKSEIEAKFITDCVFGDKRSILEVDAVAYNMYLHGKKMRVGLITDDRKRLDNVKVEVKGLSTKRKGEPWVKRGAVQCFADVVLELGDVPITTFRMILIRSLVNHFEKFLKRPEEGGFKLEDYAFDTEINKLVTKGTRPAHLVVADKIRKRTGQITRLKDRIQYVVEIGPASKNVAEKAEDLSVAKWEKIDRIYYFTKVMWPYMSSILERPWYKDGTRILSKVLCDTMFSMYKTLILKQSSKIASFFESSNNLKDQTDLDRIQILDGILRESSTSVRSIHQPKRKKVESKKIDSFFMKTKKL